MRKNGTETRTRILDAAERLYLERGYGGTSIDAILEAAELTKGAFFHHFESKHALAQALIERYAEMDRALLERSVARAERLSRDPLQQVLILVGLEEDMMAELGDAPAGCLFASYAYQAGLFDEQVHAVVRRGLLAWRMVLGAKLEAAMRAHPPRVPVSAEDLADGFLAAIEGAFVLAKTLKQPDVMAAQLRQYRNYLELLFGVA